METTIKDQVKNIFKTNAFETALELTRDLRGEYISENGVKSWNALVFYYKKANIHPDVSQVAEAEPTYAETIQDKSSDTENADSKDVNLDMIMVGVSPDKVGDKHNTLAVLFNDEEVSICKESSQKNLHKSVAKNPLMNQYEEMKVKHPDAILLFRIGDFYEMFGKDAVEASDILGITLTRRMNGKAASIELAGFPHHALDTYLPKLVRAGKRVAICEQLEDSKKMEIKEVVTPNDTSEKDETSKNESMPVPPSNEEDDFTEKEKSNDHEERVEYMLYQNDGEKVDWYGHFVNYKGLKVGDRAMMVRMNNLGVGRGKVLATASMTMEEIGMFHKVYSSIRAAFSSDNKRVEKFTIAFNNLQKAMKSPEFSSKKKAKEIADFVLNFNANN